MIDVELLKKPKGSKSSGSGNGTGSGYYDNSHAAEADHAANADEAAHAASAGGLDGNSSVWTTVRDWITTAINALGDLYLSKVKDDTAQGVITFLECILFGEGKYKITAKGVATLAAIISENWKIESDGSITARSIASSDADIKTGKGFTVAVKDTETGQYALYIDNIIAWTKATLETLCVNGDSFFGGTLSSPEFISGFLDGKGWRIKGETVNNAAGVPEQRYTEEIDNLIVRGTMRVFEMVISQLLGENDNRIFTGMLEVDHYDPETGKVYLDTKEGRYYNPFRKDDYIMVQQYNGMPSVENNHYVTKHYELIVTEVGSEGTGEDMLAWVKFRNFTTTMEGGTPETLITKKDTFVRVDNLTDPDRKGIINVTTVGSDTPYIDIIHSLKTDPDNALKGRLGNLQGIIHPLFGALQGFGEYLMNLYATGDLILRRTGENIDTKIQMLADQFATRYTRTHYELTDDANYLHNGQFLSDISDQSDATPLIDGWNVDNTDETAFWVDASGMPVMSNGQVTASGVRRVLVENAEGRQILRIMNCGVTQVNSLIDRPKTHSEYSAPTNTATDGATKEVQDTLYVTVRLYIVDAGTVTVGFAGCSAVNGKVNDLAARTYTAKDLPVTGKWQDIAFSGKWNGTGDFVLRTTGDIRVAFVMLSDRALENLKSTVSTSIKQTAEAIRMLGSNYDALSGKYTELGSEISAQRGEITTWVTTNYQSKSAALNQVEALNQQIDAISSKAETNSRDISSQATLIKQNSDHIAAIAGNFDKDGKLVETGGLTIAAYANSLYNKSFDSNGLLKKSAGLFTSKDAAALISQYVKRDSYGNITNISTSGLVTTDNMTWLSSNVKDADGNLLSESHISTFVKKDANGVLESGVSINADKININANHAINITVDGALSIDTTYFKLSDNGTITATNASLSGIFTTGSGDTKITISAKDGVGEMNLGGYVDIGYNTRESRHFGQLVTTSLPNRGGHLRLFSYGEKDYFLQNATSYETYITGLSMQTNFLFAKSLWTGSMVLGATSAQRYDTVTQGLLNGNLCSCLLMENTEETMLKLPSNPYDGQLFIVIQGNAKVNINGNGNKIWSSGLNDEVSSDTTGQWNFFCYLNGRWISEYTNQHF